MSYMTSDRLLGILAHSGEQPGPVLGGGPRGHGPPPIEKKEEREGRRKRKEKEKEEEGREKRERENKQQ